MKHRKHRAASAFACLTVAAATLALPLATPAGATTASRAFVVALYTDFTGQAPDTATLSYWETNLDSGATTRGGVIDSLFASQSFIDSYISQVFQLYVSRYAQDTEYAVASPAAGSGNFLETELQAFAAEDYAVDIGTTDTDYVTSVYNDILHRSPDSGGLSYWVGQLGAGTSRRSVANQMIRLSESASKRVAGVVESPCTATQLASFNDVTAGSYCLILKRPADSSGKTYWTNYLVGSGGGQLTGLWRSLAVSNEYYTNAQSRFPSA